jgi:hypothetical protein
MKWKKLLVMAGVIRNEDFRIDVGRATEDRTFLRIVHDPTQVSRVVVGLNGRPSTEVVEELISAVLQETVLSGISL